jgi:hypothetical protein
MPNPNAPPFFRCPNCNALYQTSEPKRGPRPSILKQHAVFAGALVAREGQFVLKYFLLRKAIHEDSRIGRGSKRARRKKRADEGVVWVSLTQSGGEAASGNRQSPAMAFAAPILFRLASHRRCRRRRNCL